MLTECRCCLVKGVHKDLKKSYFWISHGMNKNLIYCDLLKECFNVMLSSEIKSNSICNTCVRNLRSSYKFKQQILRTEQELLARVRTNVLTEQIELKEDPDEVEMSNEDLKYIEDNFDFSVDIKPFPIKQEEYHNNYVETNDTGCPNRVFDDPVEKTPSPEIKSKVEDLPQKQNEGAPKGREPIIKKQRKKNPTWHAKMRNPVTKAALNDAVEAEEIIQKEDIKTERAVSKPNKKEGKKTKLPIRPKSKVLWSGRLTDGVKQHENLKTILNYSNAVLFKNKTILGCVCGHCEAAFLDPKDLREHTFKVHKEERTFFKPSDFVVNIDIENLICTLCDGKMDNLNVLKEHLVNVHDKKIYSEVKDYIVQFKLKKGEVYDCVLCTATYETFKMLKQHMNQHYRNYSCSLCESAFITKRSLQSHVRRHEEGSFKCEHCEKVFSTMVKKSYHVKIKHKRESNISNCPHCDEPFRSYYQRNQHLIKVHNNETKYICKICNRGFLLKSILMNHIKKIHLMERNCQCSECGYRFFSKKALRAHMVKHTGERNYTCEMCSRSYGRKSTLREHMRIHNNDRRFKCEVCGLTFVQKCSLRSHLLTNHGVNMAASEITSLE